MKAGAIWMVGVAGLAVLGAVGLYQTLPGVETEVREKVSRALADKGLDDVRATVDGQTVTLTAMDNDPDSARKLKEAEKAIAAIGSPDIPVGGYARLVTDIHVGKVLEGTPRAVVAADTAPMVVAGAAPFTVSGESATTIDTVSSSRPAVAGSGAVPISSNVAQGCEERILAAMGTRKLSYVFGSYELTPESQAVLDDVYKTMASCPAELKIEVAAYTDNAGDAVANQLISKSRAQAAASALVSRGLPQDRVSAAGYGGAQPIADNATPEGRAANRRVTFHVTAG